MLEEIHLSFKDQVDFYIVYLKEIHPKDEWYIGGDSISTCYKQPKTMEERQNIVKAMQEYAPFLTVPILVDLMDNNFNIGYDAVPERLFVIEQEMFSYFSGPGPFHFKPEELRKYFINRYGIGSSSN
eukprot:gene10085-12370_t